VDQNTLLPSLIGWVVGGIVAAVAVSILFAILRAWLIVCRPTEMVVISGRKRTLADGRTIGFRVLTAGRVVRVPLFERVDYMDTTLMPISIESRNAYSKGGIPLNVQAIGMVKVSTDARFVGNAVERFLGKPRSYLQQVSRETLEGHLRGVLATLTPEEVNEDRLKFAEKLTEEAETDLQKLGLHLDTLKLQHISDDRNYLESIGREQIANVLRDAEIAESNAQATSDQATAQAEATGKVAIEKAQQAIIRKTNELRAIRADLGAKAQSEMERAEAAAEEAFAIAEQQLQGVRANLEKIRLEADVEIPAEAKRIAAEQLAAGRAAKIAEEGRATAEVLGWMSGVWKKAGSQAQEIFFLRQLDDVLLPIVGAVQKVTVHDSAVVDGGDGRNFAAMLSARPTAVMEILRKLGLLTGLDLSLGNAGSAEIPPALPPERNRLAPGAAAPKEGGLS
jgi:flotillin